MIPPHLQLAEDARKALIVRILGWTTDSEPAYPENWDTTALFDLLSELRDFMESAQAFEFVRAKVTVDGIQACPFCGKHKSECRLDREIFRAYRKCLECGARGPMAYAVPEADTLWNHLELPHASPSQQAQVRDILEGE